MKGSIYIIGGFDQSGYCNDVYSLCVNEHYTTSQDILPVDKKTKPKQITVSMIAVTESIKKLRIKRLYRAKMIDFLRDIIGMVTMAINEFSQPSLQPSQDKGPSENGIVDSSQPSLQPSLQPSQDRGPSENGIVDSSQPSLKPSLQPSQDRGPSENGIIESDSDFISGDIITEDVEGNSSQTHSDVISDSKVESDGINIIQSQGISSSTIQRTAPHIGLENIAMADVNTPLKIDAIQKIMGQDRINVKMIKNMVEPTGIAIIESSKSSMTDIFESKIESDDTNMMEFQGISTVTGQTTAISDVTAHQVGVEDIVIADVGKSSIEDLSTSPQDIQRIMNQDRNNVKMIQRSIRNSAEHGEVEVMKAKVLERNALAFISFSSSTVLYKHIQAIQIIQNTKLKDITFIPLKLHNLSCLIGSFIKESLNITLDDDSGQLLVNNINNSDYLCFIFEWEGLVNEYSTAVYAVDSDVADRAICILQEDLQEQSSLLVSLSNWMGTYIYMCIFTFIYMYTLCIFTYIYMYAYMYMHTLYYVVQILFCIFFFFFFYFHYYT
jgi:hypothetical protein